MVSSLGSTPAELYAYPSGRILIGATVRMASLMDGRVAALGSLLSVVTTHFNTKSIFRNVVRRWLVYRFQHQIPYIILSHPRLAKSRSMAFAAASPWAMAVGTEGWGESVMSPAA